MIQVAIFASYETFILDCLGIEQGGSANMLISKKATTSPVEADLSVLLT